MAVKIACNVEEYVGEAASTNICDGRPVCLP